MAGSFKVAELYGELTIRDKNFTSGLNAAHKAFSRAEVAFSKFGSRYASAFNPAQTARITAAAKAMNGFSVQINASSTAAKTLETRLARAAFQATRLHAAMAKSGMSSPASMVRAWGGAASSFVSGLGAGLGKAAKGFGSGMGSAFRGLGAGGASPIGAMGLGLSRIVRATGSGMSQVVRATGSAASGSIRALAAPINAVTRPLASVIGSFRGIVRGGLSLGTIGGGIGGGLALASVVREAAQLETSMARLQRVTDLPRQKFEALGKELQDTAATMAGVSLESVMSLASFGAKLGITGDKLGMFTRDAAKFSQALEDIDPETAATSFARLSTVFGTGIEQTRNYAAALVALDQVSTATGKEILDITTRIAPMAKLLGMSPQRAMALATSVRETGVNPETAGSSLTQIMGKIGGGKDQAQFAKLAEMSAKSFNMLVKANPGAAIDAVAKGLAKMDADKAIAALEGLGIEGVRARTTLLGLAAAGEKTAMFTRTANKEWSTMTILEKNVAINAGTLAAQWEKVQTGFKLTAASLGEALLPAIKGLAEGLVRLMGDIRASVERNRDMFVGWGKRLGDTLSMIGALWRNFPDYVDYARVVVEEKLDQMSVVFQRFANLVRSYFKILGADISDYFQQIADNITVAINNANPLNKKMVAQPLQFGDKNLTLDQRARRDAAKSDPQGKVRNGADMFADLPNRNFQKGAIATKIAFANIRQQAEAKDREDARTALDEEVRARAQFMTDGSNRMVAPKGWKPGKAIKRNGKGWKAPDMPDVNPLLGQPGGIGMIKPNLDGDKVSQGDKETKTILAKMLTSLQTMERMSQEV